MFRTANPALSDKTFSDARTKEGAMQAASLMTVQGVVNRTAFLLVLLIASALWIWKAFFAAGGIEGGIQVIMPWMWGGIIGGLIMAIVTIFAKRWAMVTAPLYALLEGLAIGGISAFMETRFPGIVLQAVGLTFGTLFCMLFIYKTRLIKVTENFKMGIVAATGGIMLVYMATFVLGFFGVGIPYIHGSGLIGIGFSVFVVVIAALNLVLDFDFIERGAESGAPKYMEWYASFGLIVTLVWLYIEILRLLSKLRSRR